MMKNNRGFTLIEVMIAMTVVAIGLLALQMMQVKSVDENAKSGWISEKSMGAAAQIERIMNLTFKETNSNNTEKAPLELQDRDLDGTGQDADFNGVDDDDDGNVNTVFANEQYGLRHSQCCPGLVDPRGNAVPGCTEVADNCVFQFLPNGNLNPEYNEKYDVYWNIADDMPVSDTKTVNIIVVNEKDKQTGRIQTGPTNRQEMLHRSEYKFIKDHTI